MNLNNTQKNNIEDIIMACCDTGADAPLMITIAYLESSLGLPNKLENSGGICVGLYHISIKHIQ